MEIGGHRYRFHDSLGQGLDHSKPVGTEDNQSRVAVAGKFRLLSDVPQRRQKLFPAAQVQAVALHHGVGLRNRLSQPYLRRALITLLRIQRHVDRNCRIGTIKKPGNRFLVEHGEPSPGRQANWHYVA